MCSFVQFAPMNEREMLKTLGRIEPMECIALTRRTQFLLLSGLVLLQLLSSSLKQIISRPMYYIYTNQVIINRSLIFLIMSLFDPYTSPCYSANIHLPSPHLPPLTLQSPHTLLTPLQREKKQI